MLVSGFMDKIDSWLKVCYHRIDILRTDVLKIPLKNKIKFHILFVSKHARFLEGYLFWRAFKYAPM